MVNIYSDCFSGEYDELAQKFLDYPRIIRSFKELISKSESLFEIGVGTGLFSIPLHRQGFSIEGIDASPEMIKILRRKCPDFPAEIADISNYEFDKKYDTIFMHSSVFLFAKNGNHLTFESYIIDRDTIIKTLKKISQALTDSGKVIINIQPNPRKIRLDNGIVYTMAAEYELGKTHAIKEHCFTKNDKTLQKSVIEKYAASYDDSVFIMKEAGINDIRFSEDKLWFILK